MSQKSKLGIKELIAIDVGGMMGGGIFSVFGLAVGITGNATPIAFLLGGLLASSIGVFSFSIECLFSDLFTVITLENSRNMELSNYIVGQLIDLNKK